MRKLREGLGDLEDESSLKCTCGGLLRAAEDPDLEDDGEDEEHD